MTTLFAEFEHAESVKKAREELEPEREILALLETDAGFPFLSSACTLTAAEQVPVVTVCAGDVIAIDVAFAATAGLAIVIAASRKPLPEAIWRVFFRI